MVLFVLVYLGGVLTIVSPCILPVLPFVFARADRPFVRSGLPMLVGMAATFAAVATLAAVGGGWAVQANQYGRIVSIALLALFGIALLGACSKDNPNYCENAPDHNCNSMTEQPDAPTGPTGCASATDCTTQSAPVCGSDHTCRVCELHSECGSSACLPTGACGSDALRVRLAVDEPKRVGRDHLGVGLAERLLVGQKLDARESPELEVVAAFLADVVTALELLVEQHLAAARALRPEMRRELLCFSAERVAEPHARASSSRYQHNPAMPGPVCVPMMGPASAVQYSTQWNCS